MRQRKDAEQRTPTKGRNFRRFFPMFTNAIRYCGQRINKYFIKSRLAYTKQTLRFLFRFLGINFGRGISCYDLYRGIKASADDFRLIAKPRKEMIRMINFNYINHCEESN